MAGIVVEGLHVVASARAADAMVAAKAVAVSWRRWVSASTPTTTGALCQVRKPGREGQREWPAGDVRDRVIVVCVTANRASAGIHPLGPGLTPIRVA